MVDGIKCRKRIYAGSVVAVVAALGVRRIG